MNLTKLLYGGDYNPEQWLNLPDILRQDIEYIKKAHINTVSLGMFSWSMLEPEEGVYQFDWLEDVINHLYDNGISVILATPSGARPKWLADRYPEVLRVNSGRQRELFGGRHNHCYTSPVYREKIALINRKLAERFAAHPAIIMWHISNEYGGECHCPLCQEQFRRWLKEKYQTIEYLNERWCTTFWSHTYQSFEMIESPSEIGEHMVHSLNLDWMRYVTDQTADFARHEIKAVRSGGGSQPTTVNLMYHYAGLNYQKLADVVDLVSWDSYPLWHKTEEIDTARNNGMQHDYMRSLKHQPFLLLESCPSSTNWQSISKLKRPGLLSAASWQAVAHGSDSVLYFQIRQSRGGSEKFHSAVIDHSGRDDTRVFQEVCKIGTELEHLEELIGTMTPTEAALIYDVENRWAIEDSQGPRNKGMYYHQAAMKSYQALRKQGLNVDVVGMEQELDSYRLVIVPMLYLYREGIEEKIRHFVESGGILLMTYWSGVVDENDRCYLGDTPYGLTDVLGLRRTEIDALFDGETNRLIFPDAPEKGSYLCQNLCELIAPKGAQTLMQYGEDFYKGSAAATKNHYGNGVAYYVGTDAEQRFYDDFLKKIIIENHLRPILNIEIPEPVEVTSRCSDEWEYVFIQNFSNTEVSIPWIQLTGEILLGTAGKSILPYETIILKRKTATHKS